MGELVGSAEAASEQIGLGQGFGHQTLAIEGGDGGRETGLHLHGGRRRDTGLTGEPGELGTLRLPARRQALQRLQEFLGRGVQHGEQGVALRGDEHIEGPARLAPGRLGEGLQLRIQGAVDFPIHLDRDEVLVEETGDLAVAVTLPLHHVAPVAGEIADGHQQQLVLTPGAGQRLGIPLLPRGGVAAMQGEIGRGMMRQPVLQRLRRRRQGHNQEQGEQGTHGFLQGLAAGKAGRVSPGASVPPRCGRVPHPFPHRTGDDRARPPARISGREARRGCPAHRAATGARPA